MSKTQLQVRISVEDKALIKEAADIDGVTVSQFIRHAALIEANAVLDGEDDE